MSHQSINDEQELKRLTNRAIAKVLVNLGESVSPVIQKEIKHQFRQLELNILKNIFNIGNNQNEHIRN